MKAEEVKNLHVKLKVHSLSQNQRDTAAFKDKVTFCMKKVTEVEQNLTEIKRLELEDNKKYEHLGRCYVSHSKEKSYCFANDQTQRSDDKAEQIQKPQQRDIDEL